VAFYGNDKLLQPRYGQCVERSTSLPGSGPAHNKIEDHMQIHPLITDSKTLSDFCARIAQSPYIAVDTEFMRENSYWPELCLVQVADPN
jgi:ribonuclease D